MGNHYQCNFREQPNYYSYLSIKDHRTHNPPRQCSQIRKYLFQQDVSDYPKADKIARDDLMLLRSDQLMFSLSIVQTALNFRHLRQPINFQFENLL